MAPAPRRAAPPRPLPPRGGARLAAPGRPHSMASRLASVHRHLLGGAPAEHCPNPCPTAAASRKLRVGMVGLGGRGTGTLGTMERSARLLEKMEIVALADVDPERLTPHKEKGYALFASATEMIQSGVLDTILIETPHYCE